MTRLRTETAHCHARLEHALDLGEEKGAEFDRSGDSESAARGPSRRAAYRRLLAAFYGWLEPWEAALGADLPARFLPFFETRRKCPALRADLAWLGAPVDAGTPRARALPAMHSLAGLLGSMYVIEGSTLGGQIIAPRIAERLGLGSADGIRYFSGYGEATGAMWQAFRRRLTEELSTDVHGEACRAACETFSSLQDWFELQGVTSLPDSERGRRASMA